MHLPYKTLLITLFCLSSVICKATSVVIFNDSPFRLNATVLAADGTEVGSMTVSPQHQMTWQNSNQNTQNFSQTPFTVIFNCLDGTEYGISNQVATGGMVTAQGSNGRRVCKVPKKGEKQPDAPEAVNPNQWQQDTYYGG